jgi:citrate synthase
MSGKKLAKIFSAAGTIEPSDCVEQGAEMETVYQPGLEGVVAAVTSISDIEPKDGNLVYRGYDIHELAQHSSFEEVVFLLLVGRLPAPEELKHFSAELTANRELPKGLISLFHNLPRGTHPMDMLHAAVAFLGAADPEARDLTSDASFRKAIRTISKLPTAIAMSWRMLHGQHPISPMRRLSHTQNFLYMLSGYCPDEDGVAALDRMFILYAEHESDVSSFTARVAASSFTDYPSAIAAAVGSLKGRLHGGESEQAMLQLERARQAGGIEAWLSEAIRNRQRIAGFAHPLYEEGDACAKIMKQVSSELGEKTGDLSWHSICEHLEDYMLRETGLRPIIDFYAGPILAVLGMPPDLGTPIFAAGRIAGWSAHVIEQLDNNRIMRPRFEYRGPRNLSYAPLSTREVKPVPNT